jgi:hypothetical protein
MLLDVRSVNIGKPQAIASKTGTTGIFKTPQSIPVLVGALALQNKGRVVEQTRRCQINFPPPCGNRCVIQKL